MGDGYVRTGVKDGIATITFHHPKSNSLPGAILRAMAAAIDEAGANRDVRVIVLRSDGDPDKPGQAKVFCSGASFDELLAIDDEKKGLEFFSGFAQVINAIRKAPCFVIGRIQGKTVGGGVGLAAACDVSYAHESANARLSELAIGIGPFVVGPAVERRIGSSAFGLMSISPTTWRDAKWCLEHGLYAATFPTVPQVDQAVDDHARELASYSPEAMHELKKVLWKGTEDWDRLLIERAAISGRLVLSEFTSRAIRGFKSKAESRKS